MLFLRFSLGNLFIRLVNALSLFDFGVVFLVEPRRSVFVV